MRSYNIKTGRVQALCLQIQVDHLTEGCGVAIRHLHNQALNLERIVAKFADGNLGSVEPLIGVNHAAGQSHDDEGQERGHAA